MIRTTLAALALALAAGTVGLTPAAVYASGHGHPPRPAYCPPPVCKTPNYCPPPVCKTPNYCPPTCRPSYCPPPSSYCPPPSNYCPPCPPAYCPPSYCRN